MSGTPGRAGVGVPGRRGRRAGVGVPDKNLPRNQRFERYRKVEGAQRALFYARSDRRCA